ncbi:MAG: sigma-70 family RNA polymerase sigma factor [Mangrovibacterium sp.]|nr:sigma-70 family RNA polymerase sigma factor [Mangrovibacterium sp.]
MMSDIHNRIRFDNGESIDFDDFFKENFAVFSSFAFRYIPDPDVCEDIVQEGFITFWQQKKVFPNIISVKAYFYTLMRNMCLNQIKHELVKQKYSLENQSEIESTDFFLEGVLRKEANGIIYDEINKLPLMEKKVLLLSLKEYSNEQIANELNIKLTTVRTHKSRAYQVLRKRLGNLIYLMMTLNKSFFDESDY